MGRPLQFTALDIETTGVTITDEVTVLGLVLPMGCRVFCQHPPTEDVTTAPPLQAALAKRIDTHLQLSLHETEQTLFEAVADFIEERLRDDDVLLIAYNGETYRGGFDLPFLRTRLARSELAWPFGELPYADLMPVVTNRFNTMDATGDEGESDGTEPTEHGSLPAVYDVLVGGTDGEFDPFEDSARAVTAYQQGDLEALLAHNISDIRRTQALGELAQKYCSKSDFQLKSLTPTAEAFDDAAGGRGPDGGEPPRPS